MQANTSSQVTSSSARAAPSGSLKRTATTSARPSMPVPAASRPAVSRTSRMQSSAMPGRVSRNASGARGGGRRGAGRGCRAGALRGVLRLDRAKVGTLASPGRAEVATSPPEYKQTAIGGSTVQAACTVRRFRIELRVMMRKAAAGAELVSAWTAPGERLCVFVGGPFKALIDTSTGVVPIGARRPVTRVVQHFEGQGHEVLSAHGLEGWGRTMVTPEECTRRDFDWIRRADVVVAFPGSPASPGTHIEIGWASAWGKPLVLILEPGVQHAYLALGLSALYPVQYVTYDESDGFLDRLSSALTQARARVQLPAEGA